MAPQPCQRNTRLNQIAPLAVNRQDDSQQGNLPFRGGIHVVFIKGALSQETVLHDFGNEQDQALCVGQHIRPDQFDNLLESVFALEQGQGFRTQFAPVRGLLLPPPAHIFHILGIGAQPVNRRIMTGVGEFGIEGPRSSG